MRDSVYRGCRIYILPKKTGEIYIILEFLEGFKQIPSLFRSSRNIGSSIMLARNVFSTSYILRI